MGPLSALIRRGASSQTSSQQQQADQTTTSSDASSAAATTGSTTGGGAINAQMLNNIISALPAGTSEKMKRQAVELSTVLNRGNTQEVGGFLTLLYKREWQSSIAKKVDPFIFKNKETKLTYTDKIV